MEKNEKRLKFIEYRAQGWSFAKICGELHISKSTCSSWQKELEAEIRTLKADALTELYDNYGMAKEARIKKLGGILKELDKAIQSADFTEISADRLLKIKLEYERELINEYTPTSSESIAATDAESVLKALSELAERARAGEVNEKQINRETAALTALLKAFEIVEISDKIDKLEMILKGGDNEKN